MARSFDCPEVINRSRLCIRKVGYGTEERGWEVSKKMWRRHGALLWCYECRYCGKYHLGNTKNPIFKRLLWEAAQTW